MPVRSWPSAEMTPQEAGRARNGAPREQDDSLLILRGGARRHRFAGLYVEVRPILFGLVASILLALAGWLYLEQAARVIEQAHEILVLEQKKEDLTHEIVILRADIARLGALHRLLEEGERVQYRLPSAGERAQRLYLEVPTPGVSAQNIATPGTFPSGPSQLPERPWPQRVAQWFGALFSR